jgi:N utilization substance protein B
MTELKPSLSGKKKSPPKSPRRRAREFVLQGLYEWRVGGADAAAIEAHLPELEGYKKADGELCQTLLRGVLSQHQSLTEQFAEVLDRPFHELSPVEAVILLMATYELAHCPETPYRVVMNEAIELAKIFGGTEGHRYVNGVLDKIAARLRETEVKRDKDA